MQGGNGVANGGIGEERKGNAKGFGCRKELRGDKTLRIRKRNEENNERKRIIMKLMIINWLCPQAVQRQAGAIDFI